MRNVHARRDCEKKGGGRMKEENRFFVNKSGPLRFISRRVCVKDEKVRTEEGGKKGTIT